MMDWFDMQQQWLDAIRLLPGQDAAARLRAFGGDFSAIAASYFQSAGSSFAPDVLQADLADRYRRLFTPATPAPGMPTSARLQAALQRSGELAAAVAIDASRRLSTELGNPAAPPVTSLGQLRDLWIECGEAAWAAAAHREEFAGAQAELLAALIELPGPAPG